MNCRCNKPYNHISHLLSGAPKPKCKCNSNDSQGESTEIKDYDLKLVMQIPIDVESDVESPQLILWNDLGNDNNIESAYINGKEVSQFYPFTEEDKGKFVTVYYKFKNSTEIPAGQFAGLTPIQQIYIGDNVRTIKGIDIYSQATYESIGAFSQLYYLTTLDLNKVQTVEGCAFIAGSASKTGIQNLILPNTLEHVDDYGFSGICNKVYVYNSSTVTTSKQIYKLNSSWDLHLLYYVNGTSFTFYNDERNVTVVFPETTQSIKLKTFDTLDIKCKAVVPPTVDFVDSSSSKISHVYVPAESIETYKTAAGWSDVASKIQAIV